MWLIGGGGRFAEPLVRVHASFLPSVFLVSRRIKNSIKTLFTGCHPGGLFGSHVLTSQMTQCAEF